nr:MAG TPA: hypothetical protein [Caudoviricetes sp.]
MHKITLSDGTVLDNLELNGNNYIAEGAIDNAVFKDNLATVTITDGTTAETYDDLVLRSNRVENGRSWLVFGQKTQQEKAMERLAELESQNQMLTECLLEMSETVYA